MNDIFLMSLRIFLILSTCLTHSIKAYPRGIKAYPRGIKAYPRGIKAYPRIIS